MCVRPPQRDLYADHADGKVEIFTFSNGKGMSASVITFGATLISCKAPDREGSSEVWPVWVGVGNVNLIGLRSHGASQCSPRESTDE